MARAGEDEDEELLLPSGRGRAWRALPKRRICRARRCTFSGVVVDEQDLLLTPVVGNGLDGGEEPVFFLCDMPCLAMVDWLVGWLIVVGWRLVFGL